VLVDVVGEGGELEQLRRLGAPFEEVRGRAEEVEVDLRLLDHPRTPDLDHDLAPIGQQRPVDLGDRRGGERLRVDPDEDFSVELAADHGLDLRERHRRDLVDEPRELLDVDVRHQVRPRREQLPELHVGRAELFEGQPELTGRLSGRGTLAREANLAQNPKQALAPGRPHHLKRPTQAFTSPPHRRNFRIQLRRGTFYLSSQVVRLARN
jgi:hypothetical protein